MRPVDEVAPEQMQLIVQSDRDVGLAISVMSDTDKGVARADFIAKLVSVESRGVIVFIDEGNIILSPPSRPKL